MFRLSPYNVLVKLRDGVALDEEEESLRGRAQVDTLRDLHDELDRAVFDAYGWPAGLRDEEILAELVELNAKRAQEEAKGKVRYLRPEFQAELQPAQTKTTEAPTKATKPGKSSKVDATRWPADVFERVGVVVRVLREHEEAVSAAAVALLLPGADLADVEMALRNAAAAQVVSRIATDDGEAWVAKA